MNEQKRLALQKLIDDSCLCLRKIKAEIVVNEGTDGVAIMLDEKPLIIVGQWGDEGSQRIIKDLVKSDTFREVLNNVLDLRIHDFEKELRIEKHNIGPYLNNNSYFLDFKGENKLQTAEDGSITAGILGVLPHSELYDAKRLGMSLCLMPTLSDIFRQYQPKTEKPVGMYHTAYKI